MAGTEEPKKRRDLLPPSRSSPGCRRQPTSFPLGGGGGGLIVHTLILAGPLKIVSRRVTAALHRVASDTGVPKRACTDTHIVKPPLRGQVSLTCASGSGVSHISNVSICGRVVLFSPGSFFFTVWLSSSTSSPLVNTNQLFFSSQLSEYFYLNKSAGKDFKA